MSRFDGVRSLLSQLRRKDDASLGTKVVNAGIWAFFIRGTFRAAQMVKWAILGRLLSPDDFGLMAIATITLGLLEILSQTGYRQALVQSKDDIEDSIDTAWSVEFLRGLLVALVAFIGAPLIAGLFNQPDAESIIRVMAFVVVIRGFTNMAIVRLDRDLRFDLLFRFEVIQRMAEIVVSIGVALIWPTVWALVIGAIAGAVTRVIWSFLLAPRRPRFGIVRGRASKLYRYGRWIYFANAIFYVTSEVDGILVGRKLGSEVLGLYRMSFTLSQSVVTEIAQTINQVMFPAMSTIQDSKNRLVSALSISTHGASFFAFPLSAVFVVAAHQVVEVLLGSQWLGMTGALQILAVSGAVSLLSSLAIVMFQGGGDPHLPTWFGVFKLVLLLAIIFPLMDRFGIDGAAWAALIASTAALVPMSAFIRHYSPPEFRQYLGSIGWPFLNALVMVGGMLAVRSLTDGMGALVSLIVITAVGGVVYLGSVVITSRFLGYRQPRDILDTLRRRARQTPTDARE